MAAWIAPERTALLVIDMQVDFAAPDGVLGLAGVPMDAVPAALTAAQALVDAARTAGVTVVFVGLSTSKALDSPSWSEWMRRRGQDPETDTGLCRTGGRGSAFYGPTPLEGELIVPKLRYSGFYGTPLDAALRAQGCDTLIVCGLTTECCVDCTVRDAFHRDYHVFIATDACAAYDPALHEAALTALALNCAILTDGTAVADAWAIPG